MGTGKPEQGVHGDAGQILQGQELGRHEAPARMPPSPLREAFELIHFFLVHNEDGVGVNTVRLSVWEEIDINPNRAIDEAVRTGLVERYAEPFTMRDMIRRGPRSAEMLRWIYGRDDPPTLESMWAEEGALREYERSVEERLEAIREAGRPKEHNTAASLPAWIP